MSRQPAPDRPEKRTPVIDRSLLPHPLPPPLEMSEEGSFAHNTITVRLPDIVRQAIAGNQYPTQVVEKLQHLAEDMPLGIVRPLEDDGGPDLADWTAYVKPNLGRRWLDLPWYFGETYFYRRLLEATGYFSNQPWAGIDPYRDHKHQALSSTMPLVQALCSLANARQSGDRRWDTHNAQALLYYELWGNRMDPSLWAPGARGRDMSRLEVLDERDKILVDDTTRVAEKLAGLKDATIHIILDNAGFELLCDLIVADFLLGQGIAAQVVFHVKSHPTYVSDAMAVDVQQLIGDLIQAEDNAITQAGHRLRDYLGSGQLSLLHNLFWTSPLVFWDMPAGVFRELEQADLVFVKGDANYRRLVGDRHWPLSTPLARVAGYFPAPLVALRTFKAELATGIPPQVSQALSREDPDWLTNGRRGVIQMVDKAAKD